MKSILAQKIDTYLFPYQKEWLRCTAKKAVCLKARQIGLTTVTALFVLIHVLRHKNHAFYIVGTTSKLAAEILNTIRIFWIPVFEAAGQAELVRLEKDNERELAFFNGSRIVALANKPENFRGLVGSFLWDEAAFLADHSLKQIENVILPIIDNPLNPECLFRVISTPWARSGLFYDIVTNAGGFYDDFKRFEIDIHRAVQEGYPFDLERLESMSPARRDREYYCIFQDFADRFFEKNKLLELQASPGKEAWKKPLYIGIDLGKKADASSLVIMNEDGHFLKTYLARKTEYLEQYGIFSDIIDQHIDGIAGIVIDETRNETFTELMKKRYKGKVKGRIFTNKWLKSAVESLDEAINKKEIAFDFNETYEWYEGGWVKLYTQDLLKAFMLVEQRLTSSGNITYKMDRDEDGHGDAFSAALLAFDATVNRDDFAFFIF